MRPVAVGDMGTSGVVLNHGPKRWPAQSGGGSWILSIPPLTEACENLETQAGIFAGLE